MTNDIILLYMGAITTGVITGIGAAMGWFRTERTKIYDRLTTLEGLMNSQFVNHSSHRERLIFLETMQKTTKDTLDKIEATTESTNKMLLKLVMLRGADD